MGIGIEFIMAATISTAGAGCSWNHPGANPYRGDPAAALSDFAISDETRGKLRALMVKHEYTDMVLITRNDIVGKHHYTDLRNMHSGRGQLCHGAVDRSKWTNKVQERGLVYCVGDICVIVPTICNNVALVTRKPELAAVDAVPPVAEGPLEFEPPAAGPPAAGAPVTASPVTLADAGPAGAAGLLGAPGLISDLPGGFADGGPCCASAGGAAVPVVPVTTVPSVSAVPETPTWLLLLCGGFSLLAWEVSRKRSRR